MNPEAFNRSFTAYRDLVLSDQPLGEYPDVPCTTSAAAFEALDSLCQELEALRSANRELQAENARLQTERDTARALGSRRGW